MLTRFLLIVAALILMPIISIIVGAYLYGWLGAFAGLGLGILLVKLAGKFGKNKFERHIANLEKLSQAMSGAKVGLVALNETATKSYLDGDEDLAHFYPRAYYLEVEVEPPDGVAWQSNGMHITADYDADLLSDSDDPDERGLGLYLFGVNVHGNGEYRDAEAKSESGKQKIRFHFAVGREVKQVNVHYHMNSLSKLPIS